MKLFRNLVFAVALVATSFVVGSCRAQVKPEPVVEYNLGSCGGKTFTVQHAVIGNGKLKFTNFMNSSTTVIVDPDQLVFDYKAQPKDEHGLVKFTAKAKFEKSDLEINGIIEDGKIVGIMTVDGELGHVYYGQVGTVDDMVKVADEDMAICVDIHHISQNEIPEVLARFLKGDTKQDSVQ